MMVKLRRLSNKIDAGLLIAAALGLFAAQALFKPGLPTTADLVIHLYRTLEFEQAWAPGVIVPRWAPNLAYGYGYPLFIFAPPLPYLLAMLLHLPGIITIETAFKLLLITTALLYITGMYLLARDLWDSVAAGLVAGAAFAFAPFALRELLLYGGNAPQYLAIGLFPWPLWAASQAVRTGRWRWTVLAGLLYAGIILSHLFQALIFSPVLGLFILLLLAPRYRNVAGLPLLRRGWALLKPLLALPLGVLLSAFFWLPAFIERLDTRATADIYLEKSPFFIRYPYWPELLAWLSPLDTRAANPYAPLSLGLVTLALAGLGLLALLISGLFRRRFEPLALAGLGLSGAAAVAMTLPLSRPVWETVSILQVAEFPWRMLGLANLGLAALAGGALVLFPARIRAAATTLAIAIQLAAIAPFLYPVVGFTRFGEPGLADQLQYERSSQSIGTTTLGEYLPKSVTTPPTTSPLVDTYRQNRRPNRLDLASLPAGAAATLRQQTAVTHRYQLDTPQPFTLRLFLFDFPGWRADLDGRLLPIRAETGTGLMLLDVPAGAHTLTVHFGETPVRVAANLLSGLALAGLAVAAVIAGRKKQAGNLSPAASGPPARLSPTKPALVAAAAIALAALLVAPALRPWFTVSSPRDRILPAQHQTDIRWANGIQLAGYSISRNPVEAGGYTQVVLYWQTDGAPYRDNLQPFVHLDRLTDLTTAADATNYTPGDVTTESNMPTFHWDNSRYVRDEHDLPLPPNLPPQAYAVRVGWIDSQSGRLVPLADGRGDTAQIGLLNVAPAAPPAPLANPLAVQFAAPNGDAITLTGFESAGVTPERIDFSLSWRTDRRPQTDYTIFAQLLAPAGQLAASFDRPPLDGAYPTGTWLAGQSIIDPHFVPLTGVPPGEYRLIVGLYNPASGQRLVTPTGADFVELTTVRIDR